ncbi:hypothetical protein P154DRAFT_625872 [Amniculicola lignicola CBS 123094]|uniref:Uncharacterized protein n=1 Tax=Amniculicola lignicola CBS 123094 TaxID=1392246 RepID=A0A6A5W573_9PLEO|nr:hypothetical protein P154DRAFT_625872 [Amniculicola lignicola CBS 123094]
MLLFSVLQTDPSIENLASDIARHLPSSMDTIQRVPTENQDVKLFRFLWTEDFQKLGNEFVLAMAQTVRHTIQQDAGLKIKSVAPEEYKMEVLFLDHSLYTTQNDELIILIPLPSDAFTEALQQINASEQGTEASHALQSKSNILHLQGIENSVTEMELQSKSTFIIYGDIRVRTIPPMPFFILSFRTLPVESYDVV